MPIIAVVVLVLQISVVVHALRTGRPYWWIFVIMAFPLIGTLIYLFVEILPGSRQERAVIKIGTDITRALYPDKELHRRAEELAICGSTHNKLQLADECTERGHFDDAIRLYESAREGQYENAPDLLLGLARARFYSGDYAVAHGLLQELKAAHPAYYLQEVAVLSARAAAALGDSPAALRELEAVLDRSVGLEARYRYAEILWKQGSIESARNELQRLIEHAQRFKVSAAEREWAKLARSALTAL
jgi:hypothetical protein